MKGMFRLVVLVGALVAAGCSSGYDPQDNGLPVDVAVDVGVQDVVEDTGVVTDVPRDVPVVVDVIDDPGTQDVATDTAPADVPHDVAPADVPPADVGADVICESNPDFDYTCSEFRPETCPGGACIAEYCIGPELDPDRWNSCSDGTCDLCEQPCLSDCGPIRRPTGAKDYSGENTLTVYVHGFEYYTESNLETRSFGVDTGCGMLDNINWFGPFHACSDDGGENSPNQYTSLEYYGQVPAAWFSDTDLTEIAAYPEKGVDALFRYSLITAKFIRHKVETTGAEHVNLLCHSMGCLIIMNMIEHDMEGLASENLFSRWVTISGALFGAREANWFDNPQVQTLMDSVGLSTNDFIFLQPEVVKDKVLVWDHRMWECNNPLFREMLIHHVCTTDPRNASALNQPVLNWLLPNTPNDGVLYTPDMYFHEMAPEVRRHTPRGYALEPSRSFMYMEHNGVKSDRAAALLATAGLYGKRRVSVSIDRIELKNDFERDSLIDFSEGGNVPAEIVPEAWVKFNPYVQDTWGEDLLVHQETWTDRVSGYFTQEEDQVLNPDFVLFEGPVLDAMDAIWVKVRLLEADSYAAQGINEELLGIGQDTKELATWEGSLPLTTGYTTEFSNDNVVVRLKVRVIDLY